MRKVTKAVKMIVALALVFTMLTMTALAGVPAVVMTSKMNVYFAPDVKSEWLGSLVQGVEVTVEACNGPWTLVRYNGCLGFAQTQHLCSLTPKAAIVTATQSVQYISRDNFSVRWCTVEAGTTVYIRGAREGYWLISDDDFTVLGYIPMQYLYY